MFESKRDAKRTVHANTRATAVFALYEWKQSSRVGRAHTFTLYRFNAFPTDTNRFNAPRTNEPISAPHICIASDKVQTLTALLGAPFLFSLAAL